MGEPTAPQFVRAQAFEELLGGLEALHGVPAQGLFGPASLSWRINRESAVFLGAGRAALLQLAHPWVAASLEEHSNLRHDAIGRFHGTFRVVYTMLFGTRAQAFDASRRLYRLHTRISGELPHTVGAHPRGERYRANEIAALRWVFATLVHSAVLAYECVLPSLSMLERERYYGESKRMAALFGIPSEALPEDWPAFDHYVSETLFSNTLGVDEVARALGESVLSGVGTWVRPPAWYRAQTAAWLPEHLREGFGLSFGKREQAQQLRAQRRLSVFYRRVPKALRWVGPYHEACARLQSQKPGLLTRCSNRFWTGQSLLFEEGVG